MSKKVLGIIIVIAVASLAGGGLAYTHYRTSDKSKPAVVDQKKNAPVQTPEQAKKNNQPSQNVPLSPTVKLTGLTATQASGSVHAAATVTNAADTTAMCVFTFETPNDKPVVRQVAVSGGGQTCDSGDIPEQEFTLLGQWNLTLTYYTNNTRAEATTAVTIK